MKLKLILRLVLFLQLFCYQMQTAALEEGKGTYQEPYIQTNTIVHSIPNSFITRPPTIAECPCAAQGSKCPPCPLVPSFSPSPCGCAPQPDCPRCLLNKSIKLIHQVAAHEAAQTAIEEENMAKTSALQSKLYELAQKYANEAAEEEKMAHKLAVQLQETSSRAQIARNKMHRAVLQAKRLAMQTLKGNTNFDYNAVVSVANNEVQRQLTSIQNNPRILNSISSFTPSLADEIAETPDSLQEAVTNTEVKTTLDLAKSAASDLM